MICKNNEAFYLFRNNITLLYNMFNGNDLTEANLNQVYDLFSREQQSHMNTIKTSNDIEEKREKSINRQLSLLNTILISVLRLRNLRKKEAQA